MDRANLGFYVTTSCRSVSPLAGQQGDDDEGPPDPAMISPCSPNIWPRLFRDSCAHFRAVRSHRPKYFRPLYPHHPSP